MKATSFAAICVSIVSFLTLLPYTYAQGARTAHRTLDQLVDESDVVVHGHIVSATFERHPQLRNLKTLVVTMRVIDTYKGRPRHNLVFRQFVWGNAAQETRGAYLKGQEMILLLRPVSENGLTSPAGLEQGSFRIVPDPHGQPTAVNGRGNVGLFENMEKEGRRQGLQLSPKAAALLNKRDPGPVPVKVLEETIRSLARPR
jgi:hypothetical protein